MDKMSKFVPPETGARPLPPNWPALRRAVFHRDDYACVKCGGRARIECDHVKPRMDGGGDELENLQTLCRKCHMLKTEEETGNAMPPGLLTWAIYAQARPGKKRRMGGA